MGFVADAVEWVADGIGDVVGGVVDVVGDVVGGIGDFVGGIVGGVGDVVGGIVGGVGDFVGGIVGGVGGAVGSVVGGIMGGGVSSGGSPTEAELRYARQVVDSVRAQLTQQLNVVEQSGLAPMRSIVGQVQGGAWTGDGATKFVDEVSQIMIPGVGQVGSQIQTFNANIQRAGEIMDQADTTNLSTVGGWADTAGSIY
jgi:phage-related protein